MTAWIFTQNRYYVHLTIIQCINKILPGKYKMLLKIKPSFKPRYFYICGINTKYMMLSYLTLYFEELYNLTNAMAPYLLLGFLFAGILHVFFKKEQVARLLGGKKVKSSIYASLIGVPLPLCSCGVIPTGVSIYKSGASKGSTVSFLISTPQTGFDSILATYSMMGLPFAILRPFIAFISGIIGGSLTNHIDREYEKKVSDTFTKETETESAKKNPFKSILHYAFVESLQDIAKWLIIGLLIAALISVLLPSDFFQSYISNELLGMLIILAVSIPLYVCATGSIPIAAVLMMKGLSPGAAIVFLMAGPATNAATITVIGNVMGRKALTGYLVSIIGSALFFGLLIDYFLPREWFTSFMMQSHHHHHDHDLPNWIETASFGLLLLLLFNIYFNKLVNGIKNKRKYAAMTKKEEGDEAAQGYTFIKVKGMDCNKCKSVVEKALIQIRGIEHVEADIENSVVRIKSPGFEQSEIENALQEIGHGFIGFVGKNNNKSLQSYKVSVSGMTCSNCKSNIEKSIKTMYSVSHATADVDKSIVLVRGENIDLQELQHKIEDVGFKFGGIVE
jgi:uncharacterized protein